MGKTTDICGQRFGSLVAVSYIGLNASRKALWECLCDCGNPVAVIGSNLRNGNTRSCGCQKASGIRKAKFKHGRNTSDPTYMSWTAMNWRCSHRDVYIRRGITVCQGGASNFNAFLKDMGERPAGKTLDRIDNDKGYFPSNCRWATTAEQNANTSRNREITFQGETMLISEWESMLGLRSGVIAKRLRRGWPLEQALQSQEAA